MRVRQYVDQAVAMADIVAQDQRRWFIADEIRANDIDLCQAVQSGLLGIVDGHAPGRTLAQKRLEQGQVARGWR